MISGKEVKVLDINSEYFGVPNSKLMENAGKGVAEFVINKLNPKKILIFCGYGNNGGDGLVAARYLSEKYKVTVVLISEKIHTKIAKENFDKLRKTNVEIHKYEDIKSIDKMIGENDLIIDSMLGVGLTGNLREPVSNIVKKINSYKQKTVLSVDVPTGIGTDLFVKPNYTVTFHDKKASMDKIDCGEVHIVDIKIPIDAIDYVGPGELSVYYPRPKKDSHKGDNGSLLVIGGGPYVGAPCLSAMAALRTGVDLVFIATPKNCWQPIASHSPNFIVKPLNSEFLTSEDVESVFEIMYRSDSVLIGPGLGTKKETKNAIIKIIEHALQEKKPMVIDADAIKPIGEQLGIIENSHFVITPHAQEFKNLTGITFSNDIDNRIRIVKEWAEKLEITIFLKGYIDILTDGNDVKLNKIHNEAMTVGGTGDVLAGIIGALLAKNVTPFNAIKIAAFLNGESGNEAFRNKSYGLLATDIIEEIPTILKRYL